MSTVQLLEQEQNNNIDPVWIQIFKDEKTGEEMKNVIPMKDMTIKHIEKALSKIQQKKLLLHKKYQKLNDLEVQFADVLEQRKYTIEEKKMPSLENTLAY